MFILNATLSKVFNRILWKTGSDISSPEVGQTNESFVPINEEKIPESDRPTVVRERAWSFSDEFGFEDPSEMIGRNEQTAKVKGEKVQLDCQNKETVDQTTIESDVNKKCVEEQAELVYEENYASPIVIGNEYASETLCLNLVPNNKAVYQAPAKVLHFRSLKFIESKTLWQRSQSFKQTLCLRSQRVRIVYTF